MDNSNPLNNNINNINLNKHDEEIFCQQDVIQYLIRKGLSIDSIKRLQIYNNDQSNKSNQQNIVNNVKFINPQNNNNKRTQSKHRKTTHSHSHSRFSDTNSINSQHSKSHKNNININTFPLNSNFKFNDNNKLPPVDNRKTIRKSSKQSIISKPDRIHSAHYYQKRHKKEQKLKRQTMIKNYSDVELLKIFNRSRQINSTKAKKRTASMDYQRGKKHKKHHHKNKHHKTPPLDSKSKQKHYINHYLNQI